MDKQRISPLVAEQAPGYAHVKVTCGMKPGPCGLMILPIRNA